MFKKKINQNGSSLLEVIVAMSIFSIMSASLVGVILGNFNILMRADEMIEADNLIDSGMEMVRGVKDRAWNELIYATSSVVLINGMWYLGGEGTEEFIDNKYSRKIEFFDIYRDDSDFNIVASGTPNSYLDIYSKRVLATVGWGVMGDEIKTIQRNTIMTAWSLNFWTQDDYSGGSDQEEWSDEAKFATSSDIEIVDTNFQLKELATSTYATSGYLISSAFKIDDNRNFTGVEWSANTLDDTEVKIQIKTAPDNAGSPGVWSATWSGPDGDEDGSENDFFKISTGELIDKMHNGDKWLQYKIILETEDDEVTPVVELVKIGY